MCVRIKGVAVFTDLLAVLWYEYELPGTHSSYHLFPTARAGVEFAPTEGSSKFS